MIVNKSMYPVQAGFSSISKLQEALGRLQTQLGSGKKATNLAEMGGDRSYALNIREQLARFTGYGNTMDTVNLRLSVLNNAMGRLDEIEGDARLSMTPNTYGGDGLNLISTPKIARSRLDEVITLLNSNANGRYLMAGNRTTQAPVPTIDELLNGSGGKAGFAAVVNERNAADLGTDDMGRMTLVGSNTAGPPPTNTVTLSEDGVHPFGFKVSSISDTSDAIDTVGGVEITKPVQTTIDLNSAAAGDAVSVTLNTRDGGSQTITLTAVAAPATPGADEFVIGATPDDTAANFAAALNAKVKGAAGDLLDYGADVGSDGLGRLDITSSGGTVTLAEDGVDALGLSIGSANATGGITATGADGTTGASGKAGSIGVTFTDQPAAGETVTIGLTLPDGTETTIKLTASDEDPHGPHTFKIGATLQETADNFQAVLKASIQGGPLDVGLAKTELQETSSMAAADDFFNGQGEPVLRVTGGPPATSLRTGTAADTIQWYSGEDSADPRRTVTAKIDDGTRVDYGVQANEKGFAELMRMLAVTTVANFEAGDDVAKGQYDAIAMRQMSRLSEGHNGEEGSIEVIATELGIAQNTIGKVTDRQKTYSAQIETMLSSAEDISPEQVAMELLAVKTRLEASYAAMASVSQLSLVNYLK
jgi:flagellin-like hook-associated protein FlgL